MLERNGKVRGEEGTKVVHGRSTSREKPTGVPEALVAVEV